MDVTKWVKVPEPNDRSSVKKGIGPVQRQGLSKPDEFVKRVNRAGRISFRSIAALQEVPKFEIPSAHKKIDKFLG